MLRTETLIKTGRPRKEPKLKKLTTEQIRLCKLLRRQPLKKRAGWKMAQEKQHEKVALRRKEPYIRESNHTKQ